MERKVAPQLNEDEMIEVIEKFKSSGLTRRQFCLDNNYPMSNFYYWQKKYHQKYPLTEEEMKSRPGRKPKGMIVTEDGLVIIPDKTKKSTKKKATKKSSTSIKAKKADKEDVTTSKKRGRPAKVKEEPELTALQEDKLLPVVTSKPIKPETSKKQKEIDTTPVMQAPVMMIKYPNGTKLIVPTNISMAKLKEMIFL